MRMQPPKKWPHKQMNSDQFIDYILSHKVIGYCNYDNLEERFIVDFVKQILQHESEDRFDCLMKIKSMFPYEMQLDFLEVFHKIGKI